MSKYSLIRQAQYDELSKLTLNGEILDLGGSKTAGYHELIKGNHRITTVNINTDYGCDMVFDIEKSFPLENETYDAIICLNTLEHIYDFNNVIRESYRVLKAGGTIILSSPFMHHLHSSLDDFFRYSKSAYIRFLSDARFINIEVRNIGNGLFSLIFQTSMGFYPGLLQPIGQKISDSVDLLILKLSKRYNRVKERIPLGYFVVAKK